MALTSMCMIQISPNTFGPLECMLRKKRLPFWVEGQPIIFNVQEKVVTSIRHRELDRGLPLTLADQLQH